MKVKELIDELEKLNQDAEVVIVVEEGVAEVMNAQKFFGQEGGVELGWGILNYIV